MLVDIASGGDLDIYSYPEVNQSGSGNKAIPIVLISGFARL
jgi:hypothetical protein